MNRYYFDHNATTPVAPEVLDTFVRASGERYGNASSIHQAGQAARNELEHARGRVAALLTCDPKEVVFCSGGTESDNAALFGTFRSRSAGHLVTTTIEHPAVLQCAAQLEREGHAVTYVPVGADGCVDPDDIHRALRPDSALISVMHVNNEIGTIQPLQDIARIARKHGVPLHSDGVQAAGRIPVSLMDLGIDLYTISGHKLYAPKGIGVLCRRGKTPIAPILFGGRQEGAYRPGTENVPGAVSLGSAAMLAADNLESESVRISALRDRLEIGILQLIPDATINGAYSPRAPHTSSVCIEGIEGEAIVIALDLRGFCISSGAACSSGAVEPSHVLMAIGLSRRNAKSCIRISLGRSNTAEQVDALVAALADVTVRLRRLSTDYVTHA